MDFFRRPLTFDEIMTRIHRKVTKLKVVIRMRQTSPNPEVACDVHTQLSAAKLCGFNMRKYIGSEPNHMPQSPRNLSKKMMNS